MENSDDVNIATEKGPFSVLTSIQETFLSSPFNVFLTLVCAFLIYRLWRSTSPQDRDNSDVIKVPEPLKKHDMDLEELKNYDGHGPDRRVCIAINGLVFDCSKNQLYHPGGPYSSFAGRDATRGLAKFKVDEVSEEWDDHTDLTPSEISSVQEWEMQFRERYEIVGKLVKELSVTEKKDELNEEKDKSEDGDDIKTVEKSEEKSEDKSDNKESDGQSSES